MNLTTSGHHLDVTPALHNYIVSKLERVVRHFDQVVNAAVIFGRRPAYGKGNASESRN
jgi:putative sigma-54 modulation protein